MAFLMLSYLVGLRYLSSSHYLLGIGQSCLASFSSISPLHGRQRVWPSSLALLAIPHGFGPLCCPLTFLGFQHRTFLSYLARPQAVTPNIEGAANSVDTYLVSGILSGNPFNLLFFANICFNSVKY